MAMESGLGRLQLMQESESQTERSLAATVVNCATFCWIVRSFCAGGCSIGRARSDMIFEPPEPTYSLEEEPGPSPTTPGSTRAVAPSERPSWRFEYANGVEPGCEPWKFAQAARAAEVHFVPTDSGDAVPLMWLRRKAAPPSSRAAKSPPLVLLHFHDAGHDVGHLMATYRELSLSLHVDVVAAEYRGYGAAGGRPSTRTLASDALAAYGYLLSQGVRPEHVVAYGHCLGSAPACRLATSCRLGGFVLHAPVPSALQVVDQPEGCCRPLFCFGCCDTLQNEDLLPKVTCPGVVIHGRRDLSVPCGHGERLQEAIPEQYRKPGFFPERSGHFEISEAEKPAYFRHLRGFLEGVAQRAEAAAEEPSDAGTPAGFARPPARLIQAPPGPAEMV